MKILFITSTLPRYTDDGQAPFVLEQALSWKKNFANDDVFILAPHDAGAKAQEIIENVRIWRFRYWWPASHQKLAYPAILPNIQKNPLLIAQLPSFLLCEFLATRRLIKDEKIDFIFAHWIMPQGVTAFLAGKLLGVPYGLKNYSSDLRVFRKIPVFGTLLAKKIIRSSRQLICENSRLRQEALAYFPATERPIYETKISALTMGVFHGLDIQPASPDDDYRYDFAFIGRLSKKKGIDSLINALKALKTEGVNFQAVIAGSGEEEAALKRACNIPEIQFIGHVSGDRKNDLFAQTKFFVFPSRESDGDVEGLPVALLEALFMGKIVVASKATNIELLPEWPELHDRIDLIEDPSSVSELAELLRNLLDLNNEAVQRRVGQTQSITSRFSWNNRIQQYRNLLIGDAR